MYFLRIYLSIPRIQLLDIVLKILKQDESKVQFVQGLMFYIFSKKKSAILLI